MAISAVTAWQQGITTAMATFLALLALALLAAAHSFIVQRGPLQPALQSLLRASSSSSSSSSEFRLLIQGTKNAYTTIRTNDVLLYINSNGNSGLGVYKESKILPLCNYDKGSSSFYIDFAVPAADVNELKASSKLLRVVSSDRKGQDCFIIEEYISSDVEIPIRLEANNTPEKAGLVKAKPKVVTGSAVARGRLAKVSSPSPHRRWDRTRRPFAATALFSFQDV